MWWWKQIRYFIKAQFSAGAGYVCDYSVMLLLKEVLGVYYLVAIAIGGVVGAIVNFLINHFWTFQPKDNKYSFSTGGQAWRFVCVVIGGIGLKIIITNLLTIYTGLDYRITRLGADALVAIFFNFMLMRFYVFKHQ